MKIGNFDLSSAVARPEGLDAHLLATTGCSSREIGTILAAGPDRAAHALAPFLSDPPAHDELARAIGADPTVLSTIADLYSALKAESAAVDAAPAPEDVDHG